MTLKKNNPLGVLSIHEGVFSEIIRFGMAQPGLEEALWLSDEYGSWIRRLVPRGQDSAVHSLDVRFSDTGGILITFDVVVRFGMSIRKLTGIAAEAIARRTEEFLGVKPEQITMNIVGVRTEKRTARSFTKVVYRYARD